MSTVRKLLSYILKQKKKILLGLSATVSMGLTEVFTGAFFKILTDSLTSMSKMKNGKILEIPVKLNIPSPFHEKKIKILNTVLNGQNEIFIGLLWVALIFLMIYAAKTLFLYLREVFMYSAAERILQNFKEDIFGKIVHLPVSFFDFNKTGDLVSRITYDVTTLKEFVNLLIELTRSVSYIVIFVPVLFYINWKITLFTLIFFPCSIYIIRLLTIKIKKQSRLLTDNIGSYTAFLEEKINFIHSIKLFKKEYDEKKAFSDLVETNYRINFRLILTKYLLKPSNELLGILAIVLVFIFFAFHFSESRTAQFGNIAFYLYILKNTFKPVKKVAASLGELQITLVSTKKIFKLLDEEPENIKPVKPGAHIDNVDRVEFDKVSFHYKPDTPVLENLCFSANKGEIVAITGESGKGKTTVLNLFKGFYNPTHGNIRINGLPIQEIGISCTRGLIAEANNEQSLKTGSLFENLQYGSQPFTIGELKKYLPFIGLNEEDLSNTIESSRSQMSTGQKQKLLIVRAILKKPKILLLDEVFSSIDSDSIETIFEYLRKPDITILTTRNPEILRRSDRVIRI